MFPPLLAGLVVAGAFVVAGANGKAAELASLGVLAALELVMMTILRPSRSSASTIFLCAWLAIGAATILIVFKFS